jgi:macrolide transport system ATP-binding/permease protein
MPDTSVIFHNVSFTYDTASVPLLTGLMAHFPVGWTGIVGANGSGKTTVLRLATGDLVPQRGAVQGTADALYCAQRTDTAPPLLAAFLQATDSTAREITGRLHLEATWVERWPTLSHGERKRAQIGVALWCQPRVLAVDEPTNHLDDAARQLLITALHAFAGVGLLVSHDRALLDALCHQCLFLDPPAATMRPGGITQGMRQAAQEVAHQHHQAALAKRERVKLEREAIRRREEAARAHAKRSKRGLARQDHDARAKKNLARLTGKDGTGGKLLRQLSGRLEQARQKEAHNVASKTYTLGIWLPGAYATRNTLLALAAGTLPLGPARQLHLPSLVLQPRHRIALTGPNGSGKSTLVRHIVASATLPLERLL